MKTPPLPSLQVEPARREAAAGTLQEGGSPPTFVEASVRETIGPRPPHADFIARALLARDESRRTGAYHSPQEVHSELRAMLAAASKRLGG